MPINSPERSASTRTERLPFHQSRGKQPGLAGFKRGRVLLEDLVDAKRRAPGALVVDGRDALLDEPGEDVADRRLARLIAEESGDDTIADDAASSRDDRCRLR